jgi:hypothetical protein
MGSPFCYRTSRTWNQPGIYTPGTLDSSQVKSKMAETLSDSNFQCPILKGAFENWSGETFKICGFRSFFAHFADRQL